MSKSKAEVLKENFARIIGRCEEAGNKKAAQVYKEVLAEKLDELQKKSLEDVPDLKKETENQMEAVKEMLPEIGNQERELNSLMEKLVGVIGEREGLTADIGERIENLNEKEMELHELVAETVGNFALIRELALAPIYDDKENGK